MFLKYWKVQSNTKKLMCLSNMVMRSAEVFPNQLVLGFCSLFMKKPPFIHRSHGWSHLTAKHQLLLLFPQTFSSENGPHLEALGKTIICELADENTPHVQHSQWARFILGKGSTASNHRRTGCGSSVTGSRRLTSKRQGFSKKWA